MAFYAHPTALISPGDIFSEIPISLLVSPIRVARKSKFNPPAKFGPQDLRRIYTLPPDAGLLQDCQLKTTHGEQVLAETRVGPAIFLSFGCQVEADERDIADQKKVKHKSWLAAPIYRLQDIPESAVIRDVDTGEEVNIREVVRNNASHNYFYLPPFPNSDSGDERYVDFRRLQQIGIGFFLDTKSTRIATLTMESLNSLYSRLMWFFTRAEYFFRPIACPECGRSVALDIRFEGQNLEAEPWQ